MKLLSLFCASLAGLAILPAAADRDATRAMIATPAPVYVEVTPAPRNYWWDGSRHVWREGYRVYAEPDYVREPTYIHELPREDLERVYPYYPGNPTDRGYLPNPTGNSRANPLQPSPG